MAHFTIGEAIKVINRKTDQTLTYRHIARLCETRELQVCFKWRAGNCRLGMTDGITSDDSISETRLIAIRSLNFDGELYLTPSHRHDEDAVFDAIENNSKDPIEMQVVRQFGSKWQMLLIRDVSDQYLYDIDSKYKNGWQLFDSPKYFFEFEREEGASASYTITVDRLRITEASLNAYTESSLLEFVRVTLTPHKETIEVNQLPSLSDESINEIVLNILDENGGDSDLKTEAGIDEACRYAVYYYKVAGFELKYADIKRELNQKIRALKELKLM